MSESDYSGQDAIQGRDALVTYRSGIFIGVSDDLESYCFYGYIEPINFYSNSVFNHKGQIDPNGNGIWKFKSDCYNLEISKLNKFNKYD